MYGVVSIISCMEGADHKLFLISQTYFHIVPSYENLQKLDL